MDNNLSKMVCRVCGLLQDEEPWGENGLDPNYIICYCCGTEFGYDDFSIAAIRNSREKWLQRGATWSRAKYKPENWSLEDQLKQIPKEFL